MSELETFEEWKERTAPSKEQRELWATPTLAAHVIGALSAVLFLPLDLGEKIAIVCFIALAYPTSVLTRRWLRAGASVDDRRLVALTWVRLALGLALLTVLSWGDARSMVLVGILGVVAAVAIRWHVLQAVVGRVTGRRRS